MTNSPYHKAEEEHASAFKKYWRERGIIVQTTIHSDFERTHFRSDLVMRVPRARHSRIYGIDKKEIKPLSSRKCVVVGK